MTSKYFCTLIRRHSQGFITAAGNHDKALRMSAWEAYIILIFHSLLKKKNFRFELNFLAVKLDSGICHFQQFLRKRKSSSSDTPVCTKKIMNCCGQQFCCKNVRSLSLHVQNVRFCKWCLKILCWPSIHSDVTCHKE